MKFLYLLVITTIISYNAFSQGCSDAGFCSLGVLKNNTNDSVTLRNKKHVIDIGANYGLGEQNTSTINSYLEYLFNLNSRFSFQSKLTATYASGFLGSNFNIGDLYETVNYAPKQNSGNELAFVAGVKIPLSRSNDKNSDGKSLPLDYQASIGTYDVITGLNYVVNKKWEFDAAVQVPVVQVNQNSYSPAEFSDPRVLKFVPTNDFKRKSDLLGRLGYYFYLQKDNVSVKPSLSLIYHVGEDSYVNIAGRRAAIIGSRGLTVNGSVVVTKNFNNGNRFEVVAGAPFKTRKVRPDGLTRDAVLNLQYSIVF
ncbi:hypothetical protein [Mucilaginibacter sp.]|uniref:hypothetical protein n=1 Tax=Mucilaginibacter sp. TaxID=1882438 RepID=UPI0025F7B9B2|nr:hypothetical protein [Mucilaginibacter sp.]